MTTVGLASCAPPATGPATDDVRNTYTGETVRIIVPFGPGGTYDLHTRTMARHIGRHIPGNPTVIVENMPGAGGMVAAEYLMNRARPDGLTLGMLSSSAALAPFLPNRHETLDLRQLGIIGTPDMDIPVCVFSHGSIDSIGTWKAAAKAPRIGMSGPGALSHAFAMLVTRALDLPMKPVSGYAGMAEIRHAIDSGEVDGACFGLASFRSTFLPDSEYIVVLRAGSTQPDRPSPVDLVIESATTDDGRRLAELLMLVSSVGRYYAAPPETPPHLVDALAEAFNDTMIDAEFIKAASVARLSTNWSTGEEVRHNLETLLSIPEDLKMMMTAALNPVRPS